MTTDDVTKPTRRQHYIGPEEFNFVCRLSHKHQAIGYLLDSSNVKRIIAVLILTQNLAVCVSLRQASTAVRFVDYITQTDDSIIIFPVNTEVNPLDK